MIINTYQDWWNAVDDQWDNLLEIIAHHMDLNAPAFEQPGQSDSRMTGKTILEEVHFLKKNRDNKLCRYFAGAWTLASEAYAYSVPGWSTLCDLCSEEYILYDGLEEPQKEKT